MQLFHIFTPFAFPPVQLPFPSPREEPLLFLEGECRAQGPHSQILMTGCPTEVRILCPKKSQLQICLPKKFTTFLSIPSQISLRPFFATQNNYLCFFSRSKKKTPGIFHRPKRNHFWQESITRSVHLVLGW